MEGRAILEKGLMWRVGNGENIRITSPRVPNRPDFKVHPREEIALGIERVEQLLLYNSKRWNEELINNMFEPLEANIFQQIPLTQGDV